VVQIPRLPMFVPAVLQFLEASEGFKGVKACNSIFAVIIGTIATFLLGSEA
jgi:hypothetical protein